MESYKKTIGDTAILRRITGLKNIKFKSRPAKYNSKVRDRNIDGEFDSDYSENIISGVITGLAPYWNDLKDTYWLEDRRILDELVNLIRLRFPEDHPEKAGRIIKPEDVDPTNFWDYFFQHNGLKIKRMVSGKYLFQLKSDPIDALLYYSYKNNPRVLVKDGKKEISKYVVGTALYELIMPQSVVLNKKSTLDKNIKAMTHLKDMSYEKQKHIARIMKLRVSNYNNPDPDQLKVEVGKTALDATTSSKWGMSPQSKFIEVAELSNENLMLYVDISKALEYRIITSNRNIFYLNSEKIEGVGDNNQLFNYFRSSKNDDKYKDLIFLIDEKEKTTV